VYGFANPSIRYKRLTKRFCRELLCNCWISQSRICLYVGSINAVPHYCLYLPGNTAVGTCNFASELAMAAQAEPSLKTELSVM
jgi:hypothetical protein